MILVHPHLWSGRDGFPILFVLADFGTPALLIRYCYAWLRKVAYVLRASSISEATGMDGAARSCPNGSKGDTPVPKVGSSGMAAPLSGGASRHD